MYNIVSDKSIDNDRGITSTVTSVPISRRSQNVSKLGIVTNRLHCNLEDPHELMHVTRYDYKTYMFNYHKNLKY